MQYDLYYLVTKYNKNLYITLDIQQFHGYWDRII